MLKKTSNRTETSLVQIGTRCVRYAQPPPSPPAPPAPPRPQPEPPVSNPPSGGGGLQQISEGFTRDAYGSCWKIWYVWSGAQQQILDRVPVPCSRV